MYTNNTKSLTKNIIGLSIPWGMNSALYTLVPQALGANKRQLLRIYIQRAICVNILLFIPLTILQFYASNILVALGEPASVESIIHKYCIYSLPYIYFNALNTAVRRVAQASNLNSELFYVSLFCCLICWPVNTLFVDYLNMGYIGTAVATNFIALTYVCHIFLFCCN